MTSKKKAPQKSCPDCGQSCHARLSSCKKCGFVFYKRKNRFIEDWKEELNVGDYVRVVGRSGTYYIKANGDRIYFTDAGIYHIKEIHDNGIGVVGIGRQSHGYEFLYMGAEKKSSVLDRIFNSPHKLVSVSYKGRKGES